ncbi:hypothetical protein GCM10011403_18150 [Pseudohongiella nitratireducens]|uniref:Diguanylate cyclase n=1 Tax=Pseudohongiella nitratireducens TaxID=1768907 RepID=A0A916QLC3_9GAMM|nr:EAL domain-containing protein [Pseudohongiella nitratireducens]GFZ75857.1 hypothetical protein GCM10011403_18150 [Pseudohongiella nitratireducens]
MQYKGASTTMYSKLTLFVLLVCTLLASVLPAVSYAQAVSPGLASENRLVRVGVYENPPKLFLDTESQAEPALGGILGDVFHRIAAEEGWQVEVHPCQWNDCLLMLESGEIDLMPDVARSSEREQVFDYHHTPALLSWSQIFSTGEVSLATPLDLDGHRIAVLRGSIQQSYLTNLAESFELDVDWVLFDDLSVAFDAVAEQLVDGVASNHFFGQIESVRRELTATTIIFLPSQLYYAAGEGRGEALLPVIDGYLQQWRADENSPYYQIINTWMASSLGQRFTTLQWVVISGLIILLMIATAVTIAQRLMVADKSRQLATSEEQLHTILNSVEAYIYIKDKDFRYQYVNRKFCEMLGKPASQIIGRTDNAFYDDATCNRARRSDSRVINKGERVAEEEAAVLLDQQSHTLISVKLPLRDTEGQVYSLCGISTDITEDRQIRNQLHQLAYFDPLTGLPNRRLILDRLRHALETHEKSGHEGALLLVDLDNFKTVNDTQGHHRGDLLLQRVARRIERGLLSSDTAGRLGADEFVIIIEDLAQNPAEARVRVKELANALRLQLNQPFELQGGEYNNTVSIGVAMFTDAEWDGDGLLKAADLALQSAKIGGRNAIRFFDPDMQVELNRRSTIEKALRRAVNSNQLSLYLQPQVDIERHIFGVEGLLRWEDPILGFVPPSDFIPVAEASGLIIPLGEWVIEQACEILARWKHDPILKSVKLSINISPRQFHHAEFVSVIEKQLEHHQLDGSKLELEVTESLLIEDIDITVSRMKALGKHGIQFALDDFGTGYASLGYLKQLPLALLKIDQSFVKDLLTDNNDEAIVTTILALGSSLELGVIAEGVESRQQVSKLESMGCHLFQGYLYGRPAPAEEWQRKIIDNKGFAPEPLNLKE